MLNNIIRKTLIFLLCQTLTYAPLLNAEQLSLPHSDLVAPKITQEKYINKAEPGAAHEITVLVTDDYGVKRVTLYYRPIGTEKYQPLAMKNTRKSDYYRITITSDIIKAPGIEYYIQAEDNAGNSVLHGYSFSPLSVKTDTNATIIAASSSDTAIETEESSNMWLWIGLGALAVVAAVAAGGGGSDDSEPSPPSGTVTISGPTP